MVATYAVLIPSLTEDASSSALYPEFEPLFNPPRALAQFRRRPQGVVPQGVDLDRLAAPRGHHPVADLGVHPGQLHAGLPRAQEAVGLVLAYAVARPLPVPADDVGQPRVELGEERVILRGGVIGADGLDVPERGVDRVVLRRLAGVGETVGQESVPTMSPANVRSRPGVRCPTSRTF